MILLDALAVSVMLALHRPKLPPLLRPPIRFVADALCVHSGWHFNPFGHGRPDYILFGRRYWQAWDAPGNGEGGWHESSGSYGGGLQFTLGTWNRAAAMSRGMVPYARSTLDIAAQKAGTQILAAYLVVQSDHGSWSEWPNTSRACGLR